MYAVLTSTMIAHNMPECSKYYVGMVTYTDYLSFLGEWSGRYSDALLCSAWVHKWNQYVQQNSKRHQIPSTASKSQHCCQMVAGHKAGGRPAQCQRPKSVLCTLPSWFLYIFWPPSSGSCT